MECVTLANGARVESLGRGHHRATTADGNVSWHKTLALAIAAARRGERQAARQQLAAHRQAARQRRQWFSTCQHCGVAAVTESLIDGWCRDCTATAKTSGKGSVYVPTFSTCRHCCGTIVIADNPSGYCDHCRDHDMSAINSNGPAHV